MHRAVRRPDSRGGLRAGRPAWARVLVAGSVAGAVSVAALSPAAATPRAAAKSRVTFGVEPANAHGPDAEPHFSFGGTPGSTLSDYVAVLNYSAKPLSLQLYATDAINTANGGFGLLPATTKPTGAGAWITLPASSSTVRVPAQAAKKPGEILVPFTLRVPTNATPGDHVGGIVASLRSVGQNTTGQTLIVNQRVGTRLFVRVAGPLLPKLTVTDLHATYHGTLNPVGRGSVTVSYQVSNTGNVELALNQGVSVSGLLGASQHVGLASVPLLLPGDSLRETARLTGVWPQFTAKATVTAQPVAAAGDTDPHLVSVTASTRLWAVPWTLLALIIVVLGLLVLGLRSRRRGPGQPDHPNPVAERVSA